MKSSNRPNRKVIVRAWGDEPVCLVVYRTENKGNVVFVGPDGPGGRPIGLPNEQVFEFREKVYADLVSAYNRGNMTELFGLYRDCVMYQDKVDSHV